MPALANIKHEAFAQAFIASLSKRQGNSATAAYMAAGYSASKDSARRCASRLLTFVDTVATRVAELQSEQTARLQPKLDLSKERVGRRLALASELAERLDNPSAIATSEMGIAKVFGHLIEKHEHHLSTDYSTAKTEIDIGRQLLEQVGFAAPDASSVQLAIEANSLFVERLIAIRDQAAATLELTSADAASAP